MERVLPTFQIEGTKFIVDVAQGALIESGNPDNVILFDDMQDWGTHYSMCYNREWKNFPCELDAVENSTDVNIPQMARLDPEGMANKYGISIEAVNGKNDVDIMVDNDWLEQRQKGFLPKINIAGNDFTVDVEYMELRAVNDPSIRISLKGLSRSDDYEHYTCFYHLPTRHVVAIDRTITELPKDVAMLKIPVESKLDPYAAAKQIGMDAKQFLRAHPPKKDLQATVVPLSMTGLPAFVERNKKAMKGKLVKQAKKSLGRGIKQ